MKTITGNQWLILTLRLLLGIIFIAASIAKIQDIPGFVNIVTGYGVLPDSLARIYGWSVPWLELFIGCSLVLGTLVRFTAALSLPLTISFAVASVYAIVNSKNGPCGCFGNFVNLSHSVSLAVDSAMMLMALILVMRKQPGFLTLEQVFNRTSASYKSLPGVCRLTTPLVIVAILMAGVGLTSISTKAYSSPTDTNGDVIDIPQPFKDTVETFLADKRPVLIDVFARDCPACEAAAPLIAELESKYGDRVPFIKIDYAEYTRQVLDMGVKTTPTVLLITGKTGNKYTVYRQFAVDIETDSLQTAIENALRLVK